MYPNVHLTHTKPSDYIKLEKFSNSRTAGYPDSIGTYGLVSGIWTSSFSLGGFIGPSVAGVLYDLVGFRWATQFVSSSFVALVSTYATRPSIERIGAVL